LAVLSDFGAESSADAPIYAFFAEKNLHDPGYFEIFKGLFEWDRPVE
jgi:hypothetical protein